MAILQVDDSSRRIVPGAPPPTRRLSDTPPEPSWNIRPPGAILASCRPGRSSSLSLGSNLATEGVFARCDGL